MGERLQERLEHLREEFEAGQARLRDLEVQEAFLRERLLMLRGAIQVLEELRTEDGAVDREAGLVGEPGPAGPAR
jgi:predicted nuclease with TOPRIM domain